MSGIIHPLHIPGNESDVSTTHKQHAGLLDPVERGERKGERGQQQQQPNEREERKKKKEKKQQLQCRTLTTIHVGITNICIILGTSQLS